jgi:hypothetical protein
MKKFLLIALAGFALNVNAQQIHLQSGNFTPVANLKTQLPVASWEGAAHGRHYAVVQFTHAVSVSDREAIEAETGIRFFDYIPRWAFIASLPDGIVLSSLAKHDVRAVLPYESVYKIAVELNDRPFPAYMVSPNGQINVLVSLHNDVNANEAISLLANHQFRVSGVQAGQFLQVQLNENDIARLAALPCIKYVEPASAPGVPENLQSRSNHRINVLDAEYSTGLHYTGDSVAVAIGDDGEIGPHIDFKNRVINHTTGNSGTHCDHVAGIVGGAGNFNPNTEGNASGSTLHIYDDYDNLSNANSDYVNLGVRITSNSLGQTCNGGYNANAVTSDNLINGQSSLLSVHSAGNSGQSTCGGVAQGFYTITGGYKAGKNVLAVGNVQKDDVIAPSSSRGPAKDGRIKPEICAVGTDVESTQPNNTYDNFTGTSMACPAISGTLATLYEAYRETHANADPRSDVMKAVLMNTADDLGNPGPDFRYGYGRVNARRANDVLQNNFFLVDSINNAGQKLKLINAPAGIIGIRIMLYWHDKAGTSGASIPLVNDLDLDVLSPSNIGYKPWVLNKTNTVAALNSNAVRFIDSLNNIEQVTIDSAQSGIYIVTISGTDVPQGPQKFVLTYEFIYPEITLTYPQGGESFVNGFTERIRWDAPASNTPFMLEYSNDAGNSWISINSNIQAARRHFDWTPPVLNTGQMMMRLVRGAEMDMSDTLFSVIGVPTGLTCDTACANTFHLKWNPVNGADDYTVFKLGNKYMEVIGNSSTPDFYVTSGVNATDTFYFAVSANNSSNGAKGRRCNAYTKFPGDINCLDDASCTMVSVPFTETYTCASGNNIPVTIKVKNPGFKDLTNIPVSYRVNANPVVNEVLPGTLLIGDSMMYTFNTFAAMAAAGTYTITAWTGLLSDINITNDTAFTTATVLQAVAANVPNTEDFEGNVYAPNGWRIYDYDNSVKWQKTFCMQGISGGNTYATYMDFFNYNNKNQIDEFQTAQYNLTNVTADSVILSFDVAHAYGPMEQDTFSVWISEDCGVTYQALPYKKWGANLATVGMMNTMFSPTQASQWRTDRVDLTAYKTKKVFIRFRGSNNKGNNLYLDNINVQTKNAWPLGVNDLNGDHALIYPNPSDGHFTLEFYADTQKKVTYSVMNAAGQEIRRFQTNLYSGATRIQVNISDLASGVYFLRITDGVHTQHAKLNKY